MFGKFQKLLYNMSMFAPFFLFWNAWDFINNKTFLLSAKLSVVINSFLIIWYYVFFLRNIKKRIPTETIKLESFNPSDIKIFDFALQLMPIIFSFFNSYMGLSIYVIMVWYMTKSNLNFVSPLLFAHKSNLYEITIEGGGSGCLLATRKELKNNMEIKTAKYIFPYFYID